MKKTNLNKHSLEILEARIAPANVPLGAIWNQASHSADGSPIELRAGEGLSTAGEDGGDYLLYLAKGNALIFTTDFNNNNLVDFNEITGIAAGEGMRLISFVDIHGDIATNLRETVVPGDVLLSLSDSNNNSLDDSSNLLGDGRVIFNNRIEGIELRTLTVADIGDQNDDGLVNDLDVDLRRAPSTHSIFGNIYAGRGFGVPGDATSGLLIDSTVSTNFGFEQDVKPMIGGIYVGTAVSGEYFSFGIKGQFETSGGVLQQRIRAGVVIGDDAQGYLVPFVPSAGQAGASIAFVRSKLPTQLYNLNGLFAGDGGANAAGGDIMDVVISGDDAGGYDIVAGNGGNGTRGGAGGSILRFSDLASDTSEVIVRSGSGGNGSAGTGGNAGNAEILQANFAGEYSFILGSGGDGFTSGGNGASLTRAVITEPVPINAEGAMGWGTSHNPSYEYADPDLGPDGIGGPLQSPYIPYFGTTQALDINGDGVGDFVYSTHGTSQLVVLFGDPLFPGFFQPERIYLDSPRNAEAMTVADLNGDGRPDIAAASSDLGNQSGIAVFLAEWEDVDKDGSVTGLADQFIGFRSARYSPLPVLDTGDPQTGNANFPSWESPQQVTGLVAGDFDGDGANELAAVVTYYNRKFVDNDSGVITSLDMQFPVLMFLSPDRELDTNTGEYFFTGQFYADFGTKKVTAEGEALAEPWRPFVPIPNAPTESVYIEATALTSTSTHDVVIVGVLGAREARTVDYFDRTPALFGTPTPPRFAGTWALGDVDTDRRVGDVSPTPATLRDFTVTDFDEDGNVDVMVVTENPANFMVGVKGTGLGGGGQDSGNGGDQSGYFLPDVLNPTPNVRGIKSAHAVTPGVSDFMLLMDYDGDAQVSLFDYNQGPQTGATGPVFVGHMFLPAFAAPLSTAPYHSGTVTDSVLWDVYHPDATTTDAPQVGVSPDNPLYPGPNGFGSIAFSLPFPPGAATYEPLIRPQLNILAGNGGDSFAGKAGNGGSIGGRGVLETIVDPLTNISVTDFAGSVKIEYDGVVLLQGGNGGLGFSRGGNGGSVTGTSLRNSQATNYTPAAVVIAGNGGRGISGAGGFGGDLIQNSLFNASLFLAGAGGDGKFGGRGGSVVGNGLKVGTTRVYDTDTNQLEVFAGQGGNGIRSGGAGGDILNMRPIIDGISGALFSGGSMSYVAGSGGNAVNGTGGGGGSVVNSSPELNAVVEREIFIEAGAGGDGRTGGAGGSVSTFAVKSGGNPPRVVSIVAGHGGNGTQGNGGRGGNLTALDAISGGNSDQVFFTSPNGIGNYFSYSRFLAGNGGESFGARGGDGGTISNVLTGASQGTIAIVSGAGGDGLTHGGVGGSVLNVKLSALGAGTNSKGLVIAGAGGDARAFVVNPIDPSADQGRKVFGGRIGTGGNGGNINGFQQGGDNGAHLDLIAGNGGSTVNYGTVRDPKPFVGRGGSILNVNIVGSVGNTSAASPIHSYNDVLGGESVADYVERKIRTGEALLETLGDGDGNVGIIVGSAGRNKAIRLDPVGAPFEFTDQPATNAKNGDLINFRGREIMSAVAGSVDRLAAILLAKNITVAGGTFVGQDKVPVGSFDYLTPDGSQFDDDGVKLSQPVREGRLIDGAFIANRIVQLPGQPSLVGRIFSF